MQKNIRAVSSLVLCLENKHFLILGKKSQASTGLEPLQVKRSQKSQETGFSRSIKNQTNEIVKLKLLKG